MQNACKKKNKLYRDFIKYRTQSAERKYKNYKNKLTGILRQHKKDYYTQQLTENKNNVKETWKVLHHVMDNKNSKMSFPNYLINEENNEIDRNEMANEFNSYFVNIGPSLASKIDNNQQESWKWKSKTVKSMYLEGVTEQEIISTVNQLKSKTSTDCDGLDMIIIKMTIDLISKPLCHIFNLSFTSGIFPNKMKISKVVPLFKTGDRHQLTNYRPISLISQFAKIIEKLFVCRLDNFLEKKHLINENQFGFRTKRSTALALMKLTDHINTATDKKLTTIGVFIDLKKAFDTIDHSILIRKLQNCGIRGLVLNWISSYLENRMQFVQFAGHSSGKLNVKCGIPQGSIVGPKLFILYINELCEVSDKLEFVLFADDTNFLLSGNNIKHLIKTIKTEMVKIKTWFEAHKLSLNLSKTKFMVFSNMHNIKNSNIQVSLQGANIERVKELQFLGVTLDENLNWKSHIENVRKKIFKNIAVLHKVKHFLHPQALRVLYCTLIMPYFMYCLEIWGNAYSVTIKPLILLQKKIIRIIHKVHRREHTHQLFINSKLLKLQDLINLQTLTVMYKARYLLLPQTVQMLFSFKTDVNSRRKLTLTLPFARTTQKKMSITVAGVKLWNSMEYDLKKSSDVLQFKRQYKQSIIKSYEV